MLVTFWSARWWRWRWCQRQRHDDHPHNSKDVRVHHHHHHSYSRAKLGRETKVSKGGGPPWYWFKPDFIIIMSSYHHHCHHHHHHHHHRSQTSSQFQCITLHLLNVLTFWTHFVKNIVVLFFLHYTFSFKIIFTFNRGLVGGVRSNYFSLLFFGIFLLPDFMQLKGRTNSICNQKLWQFLKSLTSFALEAGPGKVSTKSKAVRAMCVVEPISLTLFHSGSQWIWIHSGCQRIGI